MRLYLAIVGALCAVALTVTVALMIGPTVWAALLGILFGGLASLPMMVVVILLIRHQPTQPQPPHQYAPTEHPQRASYPQGYPRPLPPASTPAVDYSDNGDNVEADYYYLPAQQRRW